MKVWTRRVSERDHLALSTARFRRFSARQLFALRAGMNAKPFDIRQRSFLFARDVVEFARRIWRHDPVMRHLATQAVRSASSTGANFEEANEAQSKADFVSKNCIALKESKEATFWLRLIGASEPALSSATIALIQESKELSRILKTIVIRAKKSGDRGQSL